MNKYPNGMYKTTSKAQDETAQVLFRRFIVRVSMSTMFDQITGNVDFTYCTYPKGDDLLKITVNRKGEII